MNVVSFEEARRRADDKLAALLIDEIGPRVGCELRLLAAYVENAATKAKLERLAVAVEARLG